MYHAYNSAHRVLRLQVKTSKYTTAYVYCISFPLGSKRAPLDRLAALALICVGAAGAALVLSLSLSPYNSTLFPNVLLR